MTEANWKQVQQQIYSILAYPQMLGYIYYFHIKDVQLLLAVATKHFPCNIAISF